MAQKLSERIRNARDRRGSLSPEKTQNLSPEEVARLFPNENTCSRCGNRVPSQKESYPLDEKLVCADCYFNDLGNEVEKMGGIHTPRARRHGPGR